MPRSGFKKSHLGCNRCKARKVKCDESKPICNACRRLNAECVYDRFVPKSKRAPTIVHNASNDRAQAGYPPTQAHPYPQHQSEWHSQANYFSTPDRTDTHLLELRLLHHFVIQANYSFSAAADIWAAAAPQLAVGKPALLDAIFAFSSLHLSRLNQGERHLEDLGRDYLARALRGQHQCLNNVRSVADAEAVLLTSTLVNVNTLADLSQGPRDNDSLAPLCNWLQVACEARVIYKASTMYQASSSIVDQTFTTTPNLLNLDALFAPDNRKHFLDLLDYGTDFESMSAEDRLAYEQTLSYIGSIYQAMSDGEDALLVCRRIYMLPSIVPGRFVDLAIERRPRALVMVAYAFTVFKVLRKEGLWWCEGVVEMQLQLIYEHVPPGWRKEMLPPMRSAGLNIPADAPAIPPIEPPTEPLPSRASPALQPAPPPPPPQSPLTMPPLPPAGEPAAV